MENWALGAIGESEALDLSFRISVDVLSSLVDSNPPIIAYHHHERLCRWWGMRIPDIVSGSKTLSVLPLTLPCFEDSGSFLPFFLCLFVNPIHLAEFQFCRQLPVSLAATKWKVDLTVSGSQSPYPLRDCDRIHSL